MPQEIVGKNISEVRVSSDQAPVQARLCGPRIDEFVARPFPEIFAEQVSQVPQKLAVVCNQQQLTYAELNSRSNQLARYLRTLGVGRESLVGICIDRSLEMAVGILGILKAGSAYLPLDLDYPKERLAFMLDDARPAVVLTKSALADLVSNNPAQTVLLDDDWPEISKQSASNVKDGPRPNDLAYVIYTSGSTGEPKGVMIEHSNLANYLLALNRELEITPEDLYLHTASIAFSSSRRQLLLPLSQGATVVISSAEERKDPLALFRMIKSRSVTVIDAVPSFWRNCTSVLASLDDESRGELLDNQLRLMLSASEPLQSDIPRTWTRQFNHPAQHVHMFGQTETAGIVSLYRIPLDIDGARVVPIGQPIANSEIFILDEEQQPCPFGTAGELYIGAAGVGRGYLNRPELTAEKFIAHPFSDAPGARLYRAGDWAKLNVDGQIEYAGRRDQQVKLRGFRVELGEVEAALTSHPAIQEAVVIARDAGDDERRLIAYFVANKTPPTVTDLCAFLSARLPDYEVPSAFVSMKALPLSANGKVDRRALPDPDRTRPELATEYVAPRNDLEKRLTEIWSEVLRIDRIGILDDFFELGGHSLLATQVGSRICQEFKIHLALRVLFEAPTLAQLADRVSAALASEHRSPLPPLQKTERGNEVPLSFAQQRLWFLNQLEPGSASYNIRRAIEIKGALDVAKLQAAVDEIVARHEILRTNFISQDGQPLQVISPSRLLPIEVTDVSRLAAAEREDSVQQLIVAEGQKPFDLATDPLCRIRLVELADNEYLLLLTLHHIISDGWSIGILLGELTAAYHSLSTGRSAQLPELQIQYADFALWQQRWMQGEVLEGQLAYWREQLRDAPTALDLPTDYPRPAVQSFRGAQESVLLSKELSDAIKTFSKQEGGTLFMTLLAAFQTLLLRYSAQDDIVVGSPIAGRTLVETEGLIGFFVNTLVLRSDLSGNPSFRELLGRTREAALGAYTHQDVPFEKLVAELHPERSLDRTPLFQVMFALQNAPMLPQSRVNGLMLTPVELNRTTAKFDLSLAIFEEAEGLRARFEYSTDLFASATIERMLGHLRTILEEIVRDPTRKVRELPLLTPTERRQLLVEWNQTEKEYQRDRCVHQLFEEQAALTPERVAVVFENQQLTYAELNARANQLAHYLRKLGVGPSSLIGICVERSLEMIVGLLGILKAGAAYVPLDPAFPKERLAFMADDAKVTALLTQQHLRNEFTFNQANAICLDSDWKAIASESTENPIGGATAKDLAYVIYTSGSTGKPKGAMIRHRGLINYLSWCTEAYEVDRGCGALVHSSISFDLTITSLFSPLLVGRSVFLVPDGIEALAEALLARDNYSLVKITPAHLKVLTELLPADKIAHRVRALIIGGEALNMEGLSFWRNRAPETRLINEYGPTETVVGCCVYEVGPLDATSGPTPIGRPIANTELYVLDENLQPVGAGVVGELYIGGDGLARGYLNRPELTAERFIRHPFSGDSERRLYKTGDFARYCSAGSFEYLGRIDDQVKLRGFRIELGEIESVLRQHAAVHDSVVVARDDSPGDKRLVAYVVPKPGETVDSKALRSFLQEKLPEYMIPSAVVELHELPLTPNGKVNRRALPAPDYNARVEESYVAPRTPAEELLSNIWMEVLKVSRVGINDNFFDLGGHSLLATQVVSRIRHAFKLEMPLRLLFERPTVALMAEAIQTTSAADRSLLIESVDHRGTAPLSFTQQQFWLLDQAEPNSSHYNVRTAIRIAGPLDVSRLQRTLEAILGRHEILRTNFLLDHSSPVQIIAPSMPLTLNVSDFSRLSASEHEIELKTALAAEAKDPFDLAHGPLLRIKLLKLADDEHVLLVTAHHIICDAWSIALLRRELATIYQLLSKGESSVPRLQLQYADFALWQRNRLQGKVLEEQLDYWKRQLANAPATLELPTDYPRPALQTFNGTQESLLLSADLSHAIKTMSRREGTTLFMTLLAAFQALLFRYSGQDDVVVGSPVAGRTLVETESVIGAFVNTVVFRSDLSGNPTFREFLGKVRETALGAYAHQEVPFEKLVEELRPDRTTNRTPLFQVMFALQNTSTPELAPEGLTLTALKLSSVSSKFDLTLEIEEEPEGLRAWLKYNTDLFAPATMQRMLRHFQNLLAAVVGDPSQRLSDLSLMGDDERRQLLVDWNNTAADFSSNYCIHEMFEAQVERTPDAIAAQVEGEQLTYRELNAHANQLARHLREKGVQREVLVGVCVERSLEMLVSILAVLKAGGAYVPLDPTYPRERLAFIIEDASLQILLTKSALETRLQDHSPLPLGEGSGERVCDAVSPHPNPPPRVEGGKRQIVLIDADWEIIAQENDQNLTIDVTPENLAYVIYTSGSTGKPKGVEVEHRSVVNFIQSAIASYEIKPSDRVLQFGSLCFDVSVEEIYPALTVGATVVLRSDAMISSPRDFLNQCDAWRITLLDLPTAYWHELVDAIEREGLTMPTSIRLTIIGGENTSLDRIRVWKKLVGESMRLVNSYGPTEATVVATMCDLGSDDASAACVSIGRPIANTQVFVLDEVIQPVPVGVPGELYIGGAGVARGYLNRPELTAEKFISNPFGDGKLYKTGDVVRYRTDGNIEFVGRIDNQIKIRGFRVELGEIEQALRNHPLIKDSIVVLQENNSNDRRLIAYITASGKSQPEPTELRNFLKARLPSYMVPSIFEPIEVLPLTPSGKIDRRALPEPRQIQPQLNEGFVAPRTPIEELLAAAWREVLDIERVSIHENFFDLGGHSLLAARVVSRVRNDLHVQFTMVDVFRAPTIAGLAELLYPRVAGNQTRSELDLLIEEIANLSEEEAQRRLDSELQSAVA